MAQVVQWSPFHPRTLQYLPSVCHQQFQYNGQRQSDTQAYDANVDPSDSILSLSERLAKFGGGGTDCSIPLREANAKYRNRKFAGCVLVSDNESWVYANRVFASGTHGSTGVMTEWQAFVKNQFRLQGGNNSGPKLVCINIEPYGSTQAPERSDILNIGGFSDAVFNVVASDLANDNNCFVAEVEAVTLSIHVHHIQPGRPSFISLVACSASNSSGSKSPPHSIKWLCCASSGSANASRN